MRKRKHPDDGLLTNTGNGSVAGRSAGDSGGGSGDGGHGGGASMPASNASAAAQLRDRLKGVTTAATATTAGCSGPQELKPIPRQSQSPLSNAQQAQRGRCESEAAELKRSPVAQTGDPAEVQIPEEKYMLHGSHALSDSEAVSQEPYRGRHGPDCIRADDRTQVSPL